MAKFSFDDADDDPPAAASGGEKRKREDEGPDGAAAVGGALKIRNLAVTDRGPEGNAAVTEERAGWSGWKVVDTAGGDADGAISVRIDPEVLDCSICFEPLPTSPSAVSLIAQITLLVKWKWVGGFVIGVASCVSVFWVGMKGMHR